MMNINVYRMCACKQTLPDTKKQLREIITHMDIRAIPHAVYTRAIHMWQTLMDTSTVIINTHMHTTKTNW